MTDDDEKSLERKVDTLSTSFSEFVGIYENDMRGDKEVEEGKGRRGIVGWIRTIQKYTKDYPSISWLLAHKTAPTISAIIATHAVLELLGEWTADALPILLKFFGL